MGQLDLGAERLLEHLDALEDAGQLRHLAGGQRWPRGPSLVLNDQVAIELGNPAVGSTAGLMTTTAPLSRGGLWLVGDDLEALEGCSAPLLQLVLVEVTRLDDEYLALLDLQDALFDVELEGLTLRSMPSSHEVWYRLSREALAAGLSLAHLGGALESSLLSLEMVRQSLVLFATVDSQQVELLRALAAEAGRAAEALVKLNEAQEHECEACDLSEVCLEAFAR